MAKNNTVDLAANYGPIGLKSVLAAALSIKSTRPGKVVREDIPTLKDGQSVAKSGKHD